MKEQSTPITQAAIEDWIVEYLNDMVGIALKKTDFDTPLVDLGIDSTAIISLFVDIEDFVNVETDLSDVTNNDNLNTLISSVYELVQNAVRD